MKGTSGPMSAIPLDDAIERESTGDERRSKLPPKALAYFLVVAAIAVAVTAPFLAQLDQTHGRLARVRGPRDERRRSRSSSSSARRATRPTTRPASS